MITIIAGSRSITDFYVIQAAVRSAPWKLSQIVSGCAHGVDQTAEQLAPELGVTIKRFPAQWQREGKSAGFKRNVAMATYADALIAVWDGESRGTKHMIDVAYRQGLKVFIVIPDNGAWNGAPDLPNRRS